ncbi:HD domain-containing phosphohydrolase [Acidobacteriota bacterium]
MTTLNESPRNILYRAQWVFLVVSIIPLAVLAFVCVMYVFPILSLESQSMLIWSVNVTLGLTLLLSVLGYVLTRKNTVGIIRTIEDANWRLATLLDVGNRLSRTKLMDKALEDATHSAVELTSADVGLAYLLEGERLVCQYVEGVTMPRTGKLVYDVGEGIVGRAAETRRLVHVTDVETDPLFVDKLTPLTEFNSGNVMCYPMVYQERIIGVIELVRAVGAESFSESDQRLVEILGQQAAATILNVEFHEAQQNYFAHMIEILRISLENDVVWDSHLHNVARYCNLISRKLSLDDETRRDIHFAAMLHDLGLLKMRSVLRHPEQDGFWDNIKKHPKLGAQMVEPIKIWKNVAPLIQCHHELCDGSGYPRGLSHDEIPLGARILCVAEAFDTMINTKSYTPTKSKAEAVAELETGAGLKYDEKVVRALLEVLQDDIDSEEQELRLPTYSSQQLSL